jgi:glucose/arabinose dehydrogenase
MIAFGPDDCLYVGLGDGGDAQTGGQPDVFGHGQDITTQLGSMLRIDPDRPNESAPGNLEGAAQHVWSYGLRNPWRFSFDRETGDLYIGDVGQVTYEEVNVQPAGSTPANYGWITCEGSDCSSGEPGSDGRRGAAHFYGHGQNNNCVVGGYVYRGSAIPSLVGRYVFGDYGSGRIQSFVYSGEDNGQPTTCDLHELTDIQVPGELVSFGEDNSGELYVVDIEQSSIHKIESAAP